MALFVGWQPTDIHYQISFISNGFVALDVSFLKTVVAIGILITTLSMLFQTQLYGLGKRLR